jgi:hypothetical protein
MALIITAGGTGANASVGAGGPVEVVAAGNFDNATVDIAVSVGAGRLAFVHTIMAPGAVALQSASGTTIDCTITGGGANTSIDVSVG